MWNAIKYRLAVFIALLAALASIPSTVLAHGEKALEPFIRMRTIQWYDVQWSTPNLSVNDEMEITGKFHVSEDWPVNVPKPEAAFLNVATPGPVFIRTERYLNGQPTMNSAALKEGGDYTFKIVLKARMPGRYHIHPFFNLRDAGAIVGPGRWVDVSGNAADFRNEIQLINGETIDMESYGLSNAIFWHGTWILAGTIWLLWWLRRPLFIPRYRMLKAGQEAQLVTRTDKTIGKAILVAVPALVIVTSILAGENVPQAIPLQAARDQIPAIPAVVDDGTVGVSVKKTRYQVPDRAMQISVEVENRTDKPLRIGEFLIANIHFLNADVAAAGQQAKGELVINQGLSLDDNTPVAPGDTKTLTIKARDAAWETEKLDGLIRDADSRMGGLLFLYGPDNDRHIVSLSSPVIPEF